MRHDTAALGIFLLMLLFGIYKMLEMLGIPLRAQVIGLVGFLSAGFLLESYMNQHYDDRHRILLRSVALAGTLICVGIYFFWK